VLIFPSSITLLRWRDSGDTGLSREGRRWLAAYSQDGKRPLVVELKRGRATDVVVGQTLRYMGYVIEQIAEPHQTVEGTIIALEDDQKLPG
jgi:hypothetical protein